MILQSTSASGIVLRLRAALSQSGDLLQALDDEWNVVARIDKDGFLTLPGGIRIVGFTFSATAAGLTQYPQAKDFGIHKNTLLGTVSLCYNDGGNVKSVVML